MLEFGYCDWNGHLSAVTYGSGFVVEYMHDIMDLVTNISWRTTSGATLGGFQYEYDAAGRRVACGKSGSAFAQDDTLSHGYNEKSELTNAVAAVDSDYRYSYDFDDIGNRLTSSERGTTSVYTANQLNQYTEISDSALSASPRETFTPQFDDDGNQTLVKTETGIWSIFYHGENRPIQWTLVNSSTSNSSISTLLSMTYDRMGRRVTKNDQCFCQC